MFRVKICGITSRDDAQLAVDAGADAIGLNFYAQSRRHVDLPTARDIAAAMQPQVSVVGVFVNAPVGYVLQCADQLPLDYIQLHGDEPTSRLVDLAPRRTIRAFRLRPDEASRIVDYVAAAHASGVPLSAILIDAYQEGSFGGTGKMVNWGDVRRISSALAHCPLVLAGGLTPENVRQSIHEARCDAVDVASGVEAEPGKKDATKTRRFVEAAIKGLRELGGGRASV